MTLEQLQKNWEKANLNQIEKEVLKDLEPEIIDLNVSQLKRGEGFSGSKLPQYSNPDYYAAKAAEGLTEQAGRNMNMLLKGDFREGFYLKQSGNNSEIDSKDEKTPKLRQITDNNIFGLQKQNMNELDELATDPTIKKIKTILQI